MRYIHLFFMEETKAGSQVRFVMTEEAYLRALWKMVHVAVSLLPPSAPLLISRTTKIINNDNTFWCRFILADKSNNFQSIGYFSKSLLISGRIMNGS